MSEIRHHQQGFELFFRKLHAYNMLNSTTYQDFYPHSLHTQNIHWLNHKLCTSFQSLHTLQLSFSFGSFERN